jgi:hypothetical protein
MQLNTASVQQTSDAAIAGLPRRSRTRQGKARLLTLGSLDARTAAARDARNLVTALSADLGGDDQLSAGERQLVTRAALVGAIVADFEARWVAGEPVAFADYFAACNVQRRILATLGLRRRPKEVLPLRDRWAAEVEDEMADETVDGAAAGEAVRDGLPATLPPAAEVESGSGAASPDGLLNADEAPA